MRERVRFVVLSGLALAMVLVTRMTIEPLRAETEERAALGLFQMLARADLVVRVRVREGSLKYAVVDVLESIKGESPLPRLRIAFRELNWRRPARTDPIIFTNGQEEILFLTPYSQVRPKPKNRDLYELFHGADGRISLPAEGSAATLLTLKRLAALTGIDPVTQVEGLWSLAAEDRPGQQEAALDELVRLRAAGITRLETLVHLLRSPAPSLRGRALRLISQAFSPGEQYLEGDAAPDVLRSTLESVLERARNDPDETVRVAAVAAAAVWPRRSEVEGDLRAIADQDPAQMVRYEAQRALLSKRSN